MRVEAWQVHDTGLVAAPGPFRRLGGAVRHHRGEGDRWPDRVVLELEGEVLGVVAVDGDLIGSWPLDEVVVRLVGAGPPVTFVLQPPGASHLLAAAAGPDVDALLAALAG